jgi:hypothetical protein
MRSKKVMALGSTFCIFGAAGILFSIFSRLSFLNDYLTYAIVFLLGISLGVGTVLVLFNLRNIPTN